MQLTDLLNKTCLIGLSYFDTKGELLKQSQLAGTVIEADEEQGISIKLFAVESEQSANEAKEKEKDPTFILPPNLSPWFIAPPGHYKNAESGIDLENPDYLVTWDIHQTQKETPDGDHQWWEWVPRTANPTVG
ncbi:MAG: hypothetical protein K6L73_03005 [Cellvibrionaceae bacterium]